MSADGERSAGRFPPPAFGNLLSTPVVENWVGALRKCRTNLFRGRRRHSGYAVSQRKRTLVEQAFGWMKTVGGMRTLHHRGGPVVAWMFAFSAAAYNVVRLPLAARDHVSEVGQAVPMVSHVRPVPLVSVFPRLCGPWQ